MFRRKFTEKHHKEIEDDVFLASREWEGDVFSGIAGLVPEFTASTDDSPVLQGLPIPGIRSSF